MPVAVGVEHVEHRQLHPPQRCLELVQALGAAHLPPLLQHAGGGDPPIHSDDSERNRLAIPLGNDRSMDRAAHDELLLLQRAVLLPHREGLGLGLEGAHLAVEAVAVFSRGEFIGVPAVEGVDRDASNRGRH